MEISSRYAPADIESKWYQHWIDKGYFRSVPDDREPFTIVIPPPNVTGVLHMGHMLNNTIQDILIRKARMDGKNACWVPGTDHASIATEAKVVQWLRKEMNLRKADLTREQFLEYAYQWKEKYGGIILQQLRKLGASCDWDRTAFTMDKGYYEDVIRVFVDLYQKDKLYRGLRMVNWDPEAKTVLSNEEVIYHEEQSRFFHIRYNLVEDPTQGIVIATQRPETIFADVAICVNPKDPRYANLIGQQVVVPLIQRPIPVIADDYVDIEFGTGALKITPAHDPNDYEIGIRHQLPIIDILNDDGTISAACTYAPLVGLDRFEARKQVQQPLEIEGNLVKVEDYTTKIGRSERTNAVVEPKLSLQWFVKMTDLREPARASVENKDIRFYPDSMKNMYKSWMDGMRDWCISRQLWWGHRIPAWYLAAEPIGKESHVFVAPTETEALEKARTLTNNPHLSPADLRQDADVLDTWASSWLWPISVFDGFNNPEGEIKYYYPTNVLVTAPEIIFFWVARMIMAGYEYKGREPFQHVYFTGIVRDGKRRKMSKSLGNSPDPIDIINEYGADAVRFGMLSCASAGNDVLFDMKMVENGRNFSNKLWNALRLVKGWPITPEPESESTLKGNARAVDFMQERISEVVNNLQTDFHTFHLSEAMMSVYSLIWNDFCSWYLEMIKPGFEKPIDQNTYNHTIDLFGQLMVVLHPFMPFVTEEIWHQLKNRAENDDCTLQTYPKPNNTNHALIQKIESAKDIITKIREIRNAHQLKPKEPLQLFILESPSAHNLLQTPGILEIIAKLAVLSNLQIVTADPGNCKPFISGTDQYFVELNLNIDPETEKKKIADELAYQQGFVKSIESKLSNEKFVSSAPTAVVDNERKKLADGIARINLLQEQLLKW
jgi:valyl-tRNA synthetase